MLNTAINISKFSPKFGLQWSVIDAMRLRLAWFEAVKTNLIGQQTLEPTQVAGFNQFYDDPNGTKTRRKGVGIDVRISSFLYGGIEGSIRNLEIPQLFLDGIFDKQREQIYRSYLYSVFDENWSVTSELQYEVFSRKKDFLLISNSSSPNAIYTLSAPIKINYFSPSGILASLTGTFVIQDLERSNSLPPPAFNPTNERISGQNSFFLLDAEFGYRLPSRRGLFSFEARNLLNEDFYYRNPEFQRSFNTTPRFIPTRTFMVRLTINF